MHALQTVHFLLRSVSNEGCYTREKNYLYGCISAFNRGFSRKIKPRYQHAYAFYVVISVAT
jgi:hypothetical protein